MDSIDTSHLFAVIMAGGRGERFWPAGRTNRPKQLLRLFGETTMIEETVQRLFPLIAPERLFVITNCAYVKTMQELLPIPPENVIGEPEGRDTAPCAALAAALISRRDPAATMILLPADQLIRPAKLFQENLRFAVLQAQTGALVTLGIVPTDAATGYGYLHLGERTVPGCHKVLEFIEKPEKKTAAHFFRDGNYRWNSGIFVWRVDSITAAFDAYAPALGAKLKAWAKGTDFTKDFADCEKISVDYAVMEKAENVLVCDVVFYWNDVGSWDALRSILPLDENGNAVRGAVVTLEANNNVLVNEDDGLLGVIGLHDCAVVRSGNGILVCPLSEEQKVKQLVQKIALDAPDYI